MRVEQREFAREFRQLSDASVKRGRELMRVEKREFAREFRQLPDASVKRGRELMRVGQWSWPANKYY